MYIFLRLGTILNFPETLKGVYNSKMVIDKEGKSKPVCF